MRRQEISVEETRPNNAADVDAVGWKRFSVTPNRTIGRESKPLKALCLGNVAQRKTNRIYRIIFSS